MEALEEQCVVELHGEDWGVGAALLEAHHLEGVDHLLLLTEEAQLPALDPLQQALQECSPLQPCPTSNTRVPLQGHSPKLMAMRTM